MKIICVHLYVARALARVVECPWYTTPDDMTPSQIKGLISSHTPLYSVQTRCTRYWRKKQGAVAAHVYG